MTPVHRLSRIAHTRLGASALMAVALVVAIPGVAHAAAVPVPLGTADPFVVLAGSAITNTGATTLNGDVGLSPADGSFVTGFTPGVTLNGTLHAADAVALDAQAALGAAYTNAALQSPATAIPTELGGTKLGPGIYSSGTYGLTGTLTLDGGGDPNAVFVFTAASKLTTASGSSIALINDAQACHVFWQVTSSATLGSGSTFAGSILALTSVTMDSGVFLNGRALARNGTVTLIDDAIDVSPCGAPTPAPTPTGTPAPTPTGTPAPTPTGTPAPTPRAGAVRPPFPPTPPPVPRALATPIPTASPTPVPTASPTPVTTATVEEVIGSTAPTERSTPPPTSTLPTTGSSRNAGVPALLLAGSLLFLFGAMASRRPKARRTTTPAGRR